jgi:hypothetical protein
VLVGAAPAAARRATTACDGDPGPLLLLLLGLVLLALGGGLLAGRLLGGRLL